MTWTSPFSLPGYWFKGNLHCHTTQSDGLASPEEAVRWYYERGYDFLAITDHWVLTPGCPTPAGAGRRVHHHYRHRAPRRGLPHAGAGVVGTPAESLADAPSEVAAVVRASGGLAFIAHPYWTGQSSAEVGAIAGIAGVEVFNAVCEKMDGLGYARVHWDDLLSQGRRLTGLSVDDTHWKHDSHGTGYVMVRAAALTEADILAAIAAGHLLQHGPHDSGPAPGSTGRRPPGAQGVLQPLRHDHLLYPGPKAAGSRCPPVRPPQRRPAAAPGAGVRPRRVRG